MNKILLIGCGHMGSALLHAWLKQKNIYFYFVDPFNFKKINKKKYNKVKAYKSLLDIKDISSINIVIFAFSINWKNLHLLLFSIYFLQFHFYFYFHSLF